MSVSQSRRQHANGSVFQHSLLSGALAVCVCVGGRIAAEPPPPASPTGNPPVGGRTTAEPLPPACPIGGLPVCQPPLPDKAPRPPAGPEAVTSFIDSLSVKDGVFEV